MKCDDIKLLLAEYLEGSLPAGDAAAVKEHLRTCADCREELQFLKKYMKKTESFPTLKAPDDFLEKIHRKIDAPDARHPYHKAVFPLKIKVPLEVAALLALAVTGLLLFKPFRPEMTEYRAEEPGPEMAMEERESRHHDDEMTRSDRPACGQEGRGSGKRLRRRRQRRKSAASRSRGHGRVKDGSRQNNYRRKREKSPAASRRRSPST